MGIAPIGGDPSDLEPHDILAAEAFGVPAGDPSITHGPVVLPDDPSGIIEPHDVLAAEEFALPASPPHPGGVVERPGRGGGRPRAVGLTVLGLVILSLILRRRRRRAA
jgi:hypothetical protein